MPNPLQEDRGLIRIHEACVAMKAIWRPTPCHDVGVDGQIEFLDETDPVTSTGKLIAVQVKSGPSYFKHENVNGYKYYPSRKHVRYWRALNLPVLLVLHNPDTNLTVYSEIKPQLKTEGPIFVSNSQVLCGASRNDILDICSRVDDPKRFLGQLKKACLQVEPGKAISGIEFLVSCLSPDNTYFELRMARLKQVIELAVESSTIGVGSDTYDFILRCSMICMAADITDSFEESFDLQWYDLKLVPDITVPLTPFGAIVADYLYDNAGDYMATDAFAHNSFGDPIQVYETLKRECQSISDYIDSKATLYAHHT